MIYSKYNLWKFTNPKSKIHSTPNTCACCRLDCYSPLLSAEYEDMTDGNYRKPAAAKIGAKCMYDFSAARIGSYPGWRNTWLLTSTNTHPFHPTSLTFRK